MYLESKQTLSLNLLYTSKDRPTYITFNIHCMIFFSVHPFLTSYFSDTRVMSAKMWGVGGNLFKNFIKNGFHLLLLLGPAANGGVIK